MKKIFLFSCFLISVVMCFAQNTTNNLSVHFRAYADIHASDSMVTLDLTQNIYTHVTNPTNTLLSSHDSLRMIAGGDSIIAQLGGMYRIDVHLSLEGNSQDIYEAVVFVDNILVNDHKVSRKTANNDVGDMSFSGIYEIFPGQSLKIMIRNTANDNDPNIVNACLIAHKIDK